MRGATIIRLIPVAAIVLAAGSAGADLGGSIRYLGAISPTSIDDGLRGINDVARGPGGDLYILSSETRSVEIRSPDGILIFRFSLPNDLSDPRGIGVLPDGDIVVATFSNGVHRFSYDGSHHLDIPLDGPANQIRSFAVSEDGLLYIGDLTTNTVRVFTPDGRLVSSIGASVIRRLGGFCLLPGGGTAIADQAGYRIHVFSADGNDRYSFGRAGGVDGTFSLLTGLTVDAEGRFWVIDARKERVMVFDRSGAFIVGVSVPSPQGILFGDGRAFVTSLTLPGIVVLEMGT